MDIDKDLTLFHIGICSKLLKVSLEIGRPFNYPEVSWSTILNYNCFELLLCTLTRWICLIAITCLKVKKKKKFSKTINNYFDNISSCYCIWSKHNPHGKINQSINQPITIGMYLCFLKNSPKTPIELIFFYISITHK